MRIRGGAWAIKVIPRKRSPNFSRENRKVQSNVAWEPIPPDDHDAYRNLRAQKILPIATGEHEQEEEGF